MNKYKQCEIVSQMHDRSEMKEAPERAHERERERERERWFQDGWFSIHKLIGFYEENESIIVQ